MDRALVESLLSGISPAQLSAVAPALAPEASSAARICAVEAALKAAGPAWRREIGKWITEIIPVELLVPGAYGRWRPLVRDAVQFVFSRLSDRRLAEKLVEQIELPPGTPAESRLLRLIGKMPGLQKVGQVLARNRSLAPSLRTALTELENGMSDVTWEQIRAIILNRLGRRLEAYAVEMEASIFAEASVSAVVRFTWRNPGRERERGVFKVLKAHVPSCFAEDMSLVQQLGEFLASGEQGYGFAIREVKETLADVRLLLEHELDFAREQATLLEVFPLYRSSLSIRVPRLIQPLCAAEITAMSAENGVKVTDAFPRSPIRRRRVAEQLIEALIAVPLFCSRDTAIFHGDPHAGNLMYDEPNRELVVLDWALAEHLSLETRRHVVMLALMMILGNAAGVSQAVLALSRDKAGRRRTRERLIRRLVDRFFAELPSDRAPGTLDAMMLLDEIALHGVRFPASLFLFRKMLFTLDGVIHDIAGPAVRMDHVIAREFLTRWVASFGTFRSPLRIKDIAAIQWNALLSPARSWRRRLQSGQP